MTSEIQISSISGLKLTLHPLGARIISFIVPIESGPKEIVEYHPDLEKYQTIRKFSGATVGPFANRIKAAQFSLKGNVYKLEMNDGDNCLHSGSKGLHLLEWNVVEHLDNEVLFEAKRNHLEDGFPGNRIFRCRYTLEEDALIINFYAESDLDTVVNMTNHSYFNLDNEAHLDNHFFMIDSKGALTLDEHGIPLGTVIPPLGKFNLASFQRLEDRDFDHNFILANQNSIEMVGAAYCPNTDITLEVYTDQPGLQFYTGNKKFFAFETQHFPDSPNQSKFPSTIVSEDRPYEQTCIYRLNY